MMKPVFIIAEAGVNHNGVAEIAFQLVDAAAAAGADAVKFQTFKSEKLVTKTATKAEYQKKATDLDESQYEMLKKLELSHDNHHKLKNYCEKKGIQFLSTAFDDESLDFLVSEIGISTLKISSGDLTNGPLLLAHARTKCDLIVSTGMATLDEVEAALGVIAFGLTENQSPSLTAFRAAYLSEDGQRLLKEKVTLLHCTSEYPAALEDINLNAMLTMSKAFGLKVGYSDHSEGIAVPIAATSLGAILIEKHFTLDKSLPGPDHKASLSPDELSNMVTAIRQVEKALGSYTKKPTKSEIKNRNIVRKSLVAISNIYKGDVYTKDNITAKRPGDGVSPMEYWDYLETKALDNVLIDEFVK